MTNSPTLEEFEQFAQSYAPFPWEIAEEDAFQPADVKGKHSVLVSLVRFWKVLVAVAENCPEFRTVVDVGPYPGAMIKLLRHFFHHDFEYWGIGLGLADDYRGQMEKLGGRCFETELDPRFPDAAAVQEWPVRNADCVLLLDVIEHLVDPLPCLDSINRALGPGGTLILTTDNVTGFGNVYQMLRRGHSPNIHPLRSSYFFRGDWRPHFREFSAGELEFFLKHAGFSIVSHEFFERRQGDYYCDAGGRIRSRDRYRGIKGWAHRAILRAAPHLKDHQIVVASKTAQFEEVERNRVRPTTSKAEWLKMQSQAGL
jgi:SAM-dependent methyltransferase